MEYYILMKSLFMTLKNIENDIYSWWSSETLQTFIRKYRNNYANVENEFKLQKIKKKFLNLKKKILLFYNIYK